MDRFVGAIGDFIAAILGRLGYVGRPRRRSEIRDDMKLLDEVARSKHLGEQSRGYPALKEWIEDDIRRLAGVKIEGDKYRPWGSIAFGLIFGLPLAFLTYTLVRDGFNWLALLPGLVAAFLLLATLSMLLLGLDTEPDTDQKDQGQQPGP